jgi:lipoprotein-anchoring transpeptidase ErfK/SrfK
MTRVLWRTKTRRACSIRVAVVVGVLAAALAVVPLAGATDGSPAKSAAPGTTELLSLPRAGEIISSRLVVRSKPAKTAPAVVVMHQFRPDFRRQIVLALAWHVDVRDKTWFKIVVPGRPNGRRGWVLANGVSLRTMYREIRIDRSARRLELWQGDRLLLRTKIAVGAKGMETPLGTFYITWKFVPNAPILGAYAFETSAYSKLSDWPGGGIVGIHGTPWPWLLGQAVSHGCIRVHNRAILKLRKLVNVGTPIRITA